MGNDVKNFAYYADRAEEQLRMSMGRDENGLPTMIGEGVKTRHVMRADVYARLACGAPKVTTPGVCPGRLFPVPPNGEFKICVLGTGHIGDHLTGNGVSFID